MSRTGGIGEGAATVAQLPAAGARVAAKRVEPQGDDTPAFSEHVEMLERSVEQPDAQGRSRTMSPAAEPTEAEAHTSEGNADGAKSKVRMRDVLQETMLLIERMSSVEEVQQSTPQSEGPSQGVSESANRPAAQSWPSASKSRIPDFIAPRQGSAANVEPVGIGERPPAQPSAHRAIAGEAVPDDLSERLETRAARSDGSGRPEQVSATAQRERPFREAISGRAYTPVENVSVKVVRQETHLAPVQQMSPIAQIAKVVAAQLGKSSEAESAPDLSHSPTRAPVNSSVRILTIGLEPAELGSISIRMRLDGGTLELMLDAQKPATAELIRRDQGALTGLLRSAGYDVEGVIVQLADSDRSFAGGLQQSSNFASAQTQSGWSQPDGRSGGAHQHDQRSQDTGGRSPAGPGREPMEPEPRLLKPRGIYI